jgi:hypothetical protein
MAPKRNILGHLGILGAIIIRMIEQQICVGLDVSTTCVGVCAVSADDQRAIVRKFAIDLRKVDGLNNKADTVIRTLVGEFIAEYRVTDWYIEQNMSFFSSGKSSAQTMLLLGKMNALVAFGVWREFGIEPKHVNVRTARKRLGITGKGKKQVFAAVCSLLPGERFVASPASMRYDVADAWVVVAGGMM